MLLAFVGPPALSSLRRRSLLARCQNCAPEIEDLRATYFYAVQCARALTDDELARLMHILGVDAVLPARAHNEVALGPRPGTDVPVVEQGHRHPQKLRPSNSCAASSAVRSMPLPPDTLPSAVLPLLYDRMTEAPLDSLETPFSPRGPQATSPHPGAGRRPVCARGGQPRNGLGPLGRGD